MSQPVRKSNQGNGGRATAPVPKPQPKDYVLREIIGKGSFGTVYKAYKTGSRETVAIKVMKITGLSKEQKDNLITEITILKRVKNRFVVELKDFSWDDYYIYLIFEYCAGGELSQFIRTARIVKEDVAKHFLQQIATAMSALRSHQIAHMDLKPQNILLTRPLSGRRSSFRNVILKVVDFGLSQILKSDNGDDDVGTSFRGSPLYMAPEIFTRHVYDARVDLWSVGIILYECLFGQPPFRSPTRSGLIEKITDIRPIRIPPVGSNVRISPHCKELLLRLLQRDPSRRITFEEFFTHPFIDLEHAPTPESYLKGVRLIADAVKADKDSDFKTAFNLYQDGLLYLVPIYQWGDVENVSDDAKAEELKVKLLHYMSRAERLKEKCEDLSPLTQQEEEEAAHAFELLDEAFELARLDVYREALDLYSEAFEILVPLVAKLKSSEEREALKAQVSRHMTRAERVKELLKEQDQQALINGTLNMKLRSGKEIGPNTERNVNINNNTLINGEALTGRSRAIATTTAAQRKLSRSPTKVTATGRRARLPNSEFILRTFHFKDSLSSVNPCNVQ